MPVEHHTPIFALIGQCQQLADRIFHQPVRVRVELFPSLDGDSWRAQVCSSLGQIPTERVAVQPLLTTPLARGKQRALQELLAALSSRRDDHPESER